MNDTQDQVVETLAHELALAMEHYEDDENRWFPQAIDALQAAASYLALCGRALPEPAAFVLRRVGRL